MFILKAIWAFLTSRWLWIFIGLTLLSWLIVIYGPLLAFGEAKPLANETTQTIIIILLYVIWLVWWITAKIKAIRANRMRFRQRRTRLARSFKRWTPTGRGV